MGITKFISMIVFIETGYQNPFKDVTFAFRVIQGWVGSGYTYSLALLTE